MGIKTTSVTLKSHAARQATRIDRTLFAIGERELSSTSGTCVWLAARKTKMTTRSRRNSLENWDQLHYQAQAEVVVQGQEHELSTLEK